MLRKAVQKASECTAECPLVPQLCVCVFYSAPLPPVRSLTSSETTASSPRKIKLTFLWLDCRMARCYSCLWRTCLQTTPTVTHLSTHHNLPGHSPVTMVTQAASYSIGYPAVRNRPLTTATASEWQWRSHAPSRGVTPHFLPSLLLLSAPAHMTSVC